MTSQPASSSPSTRCQAIVLAAGRGQRFDPSGQQCKLNQKLDDGRTVIQATVQTVAQVFPEFLIIARETKAPHSATLDAECLQRYEAHLRFCPDAEKGMGHSLAFGFAQLAPECEACLVVLADMPWLQISTLQRLRDQLLHNLDTRGSTIIAPTYQGQRGHPVGFTRSHFAELMTLHGDQGARALLKSYPVQEIAVDDVGVLRDLDTPADLGELKYLHTEMSLSALNSR